MNIVSKLSEIAKNFGFENMGWAPLERPISIDIYKNWLERDYHGSMKYLADHFEQKEHPGLLAPRAKTALVFTKTYLPHPYANGIEWNLKIAQYARGDDYHFSFKDELNCLGVGLKEQFKNHKFLCFTDSSPVLERDLAYRAGLGWIGKNTCLIHPERGSMFFIGEIFTTLEIDEPRPEPVNDFCGQCDRCIKACPTQALEAPRQLNATKCISYWTIEARENPPTELREHFDGWFFGCDICQMVCPWNEKAFGKELLRGLNTPNSKPSEEDDLRWILQSSNRDIEVKLGNSPLLRARVWGLKRNALLIVGSKRLKSLRPEVLTCLKNEKLNEIALWTLNQLD